MTAEFETTDIDPSALMPAWASHWAQAAPLGASCAIGRNLRQADLGKHLSNSLRSCIPMLASPFGTTLA
jgi:hypothetical protein